MISSMFNSGKKARLDQALLNLRHKKNLLNQGKSYITKAIKFEPVLESWEYEYDMNDLTKLMDMVEDISREILLLDFKISKIERQLKELEEKEVRCDDEVWGKSYFKVQ